MSSDFNQISIGGINPHHGQCKKCVSESTCVGCTGQWLGVMIPNISIVHVGTCTILWLSFKFQQHWRYTCKYWSTDVNIFIWNALSINEYQSL